jgi:hypothetical protein
MSQPLQGQLLWCFAMSRQKSASFHAVSVYVALLVAGATTVLHSGFVTCGVGYSLVMGDKTACASDCHATGLDLNWGL